VQEQLREFCDLESEFWRCKSEYIGGKEVQEGSLCVIRYVSCSLLFTWS
jgi:hypothetical protein